MHFKIKTWRMWNINKTFPVMAKLLLVFWNLHMFTYSAQASLILKRKDSYIELSHAQLHF